MKIAVAAAQAVAVVLQRWRLHRHQVEEVGAEPITLLPSLQAQPTHRTVRYQPGPGHEDGTATAVRAAKTQRTDEEGSDALALEPDVFKSDDPKEIAKSLKMPDPAD